MNKIVTTVYLSKELKDLAKKNKVNLSLFLEDALSFSLSLSDEKQELLSKKEKMSVEINLIESKLNLLNEEMIIEKELERRKEFNEDLIRTKKLYFSNAAENDSSIRKRAIDFLVEKYDLPRDRVVTLLLDKRFKSPENVGGK